MDGLLVDADDPITRLLHETDDLQPSDRVVPLFGLCRALYTDANIWRRDRTAIIRRRNARRRFCGVDAENISSCATELDMAKIARLEHEIFVVKE